MVPISKDRIFCEKLVTPHFLAYHYDFIFWGNVYETDDKHCSNAQPGCGNGPVEVELPGGSTLVIPRYPQVSFY